MQACKACCLCTLFWVEEKARKSKLLPLRGPISLLASTKNPNQWAPQWSSNIGLTNHCNVVAALDRGSSTPSEITASSLSLSLSSIPFFKEEVWAFHWQSLVDHEASKQSQCCLFCLFWLARECCSLRCDVASGPVTSESRWDTKIQNVIPGTQKVLDGNVWPSSANACQTTTLSSFSSKHQWLYWYWFIEFLINNKILNRLLGVQIGHCRKSTTPTAYTIHPYYHYNKSSSCPPTKNEQIETTPTQNFLHNSNNNSKHHIKFIH